MTERENSFDHDIPQSFCEKSISHEINQKTFWRHNQNVQADQEDFQQ